MQKMQKSSKGIWDKWAELNSQCINLLLSLINSNYSSHKWVFRFRHEIQFLSDIRKQHQYKWSPGPLRNFQQLCVLPLVFIAWSSVKWIPTTPCIPFCMSTARSGMSLPARLQEGRRQLCHVPSTWGTGWRHLQRWRDTPIPSQSQNPCWVTQTSCLSWCVLTWPSLTSHSCHTAEVRLLSRKLPLTAKILIDYQIYVLQNSPLEAGQAVLQV